MLHHEGRRVERRRAEAFPTYLTEQPELAILILAMAAAQAIGWITIGILRLIGTYFMFGGIGVLGLLLGMFGVSVVLGLFYAMFKKIQDLIHKCGVLLTAEGRAQRRRERELTRQRINLAK